MFNLFCRRFLRGEKKKKLKIYVKNKKIFVIYYIIEIIIYLKYNIFKEELLVNFLNYFCLVYLNIYRMVI